MHQEHDGEELLATATGRLFACPFPSFPLSGVVSPPVFPYYLSSSFLSSLSTAPLNLASKGDMLAPLDRMPREAAVRGAVSVC
jgi:hypothetical protein